MSDSDNERDVSKLAREVIAELEPGTIIDNRVILSRRQAVGLATGAISLGALSGFGASSAQAQSAGAVGTDADRVDVFGYDLDASNSIVDPSGVSHTGELADASDVTSNSTTEGYELSVDGDVYEFVEE